MPYDWTQLLYNKLERKSWHGGTREGPNNERGFFRGTGVSLELGYQKDLIN